MTSDRRCFALLSCPRPSWDHLKHWSLSSVLYQLLLGFLAAFLPDVIGFEGSLQEFTCSHVVNMCYLGTELDSSLSDFRQAFAKTSGIGGRAKHLLTFSRNRYLCYHVFEDILHSFPTPHHLAIPLKEPDQYFGKRNNISYYKK